MNAARWKPLLGFGLLAAGVFVGAVWLGFGDLLPGARPWFPVAVAALVIAGFAVLFFSRPTSAESALAKNSRDVVSALERQRDQLERIATLSELLGASLKGIGDRVGDIGQRLDRHGSRLEQLAVEFTKAMQPQEESPATPDPGGETDGAASHQHFGPALKAACKHYLDQGDGHFNAKGLKAKLAVAGIDVEVRGLDDGTGKAVLVIDDPQAGDGSFFVVPDFTRSPSDAQHWFDDESSGRLGRRTNELKRLARGKWSENGTEVVERGSVA